MPERTDHNEAMRLADSIHEMNNAAYMTAIAHLKERNRQQAERIAELEGERDKLTQGIAQGLDGQTLLTDLALREGGLYAGIEGGAAGLLAAGFAEQFVEAGGVNYVEVSFTHPKTGPLIVTLQRAQGKTPHKLRVEAEAERDQLREEVERLRVDGERMDWLLWRIPNAIRHCVGELADTSDGDKFRAAIDHARTTHKDEG